MKDHEQLANHWLQLDNDLCFGIKRHSPTIQRFYEQFQLVGNWFSQMGRTIRIQLCKKNFLQDGQTSEAKLSSWPFNLPGAQPLMKPLPTTDLHTVDDNEVANLKGQSQQDLVLLENPMKVLVYNRNPLAVAPY